MKELEEILEYFKVMTIQMPNTPAGTTKIGKVLYDEFILPEEALKHQLLAWRDKAVQEARIDEVNRLSRYVEIRNTADGATISAEYLYRQARKRINQLEKEGK